jgi:hypothetical protein
VLSLFKPKPKSAVHAGPQNAEAVKRDRQQNIKVSQDCSVAFAALAKAQGLSRAALFEDMVAERLALLERQGLKLDID